MKSETPKEKTMTDYAASRAVIRIGGTGARAFLQGLVSNDVGRLDDGGYVYAALLTPQGKYIADFFLLADGDAVLLDVDATQADDLLRRLTMYKLRSPVTIERSALNVSRGTGSAPEGAHADPRDPALGWRLISEVAMADGPEDWEALHVSRAVPRAGVELGPESYILEMGFERLNGVDFRKGCFVGQEVVARMKHKTELRKGLARVRIDGEAEPGCDITAEGKPAGVLHSRAGNEALAYLRFDRARGAMKVGTAGATLITPAIDSFA